jgi:glycosyltransferase involved in cell wall biosynthesis
MPLISISDSQRRPLPWANWCATIHHGLPRDLYALGTGAGGYLAFIGRISPEKRLDRAIEIARRVGLPLRIAAKVDRVDRSYFDEIIRPLLEAPNIEFLGEISEDNKRTFLGEAAALLFPIDWPEPFGLAMIEAMANGTPTVAFHCGAVPEVLDEGVTGFIVDDVETAVAAVTRALGLNRVAIRRRFEQRFGADRMARNYVAVYEGLVDGLVSCRSEPRTIEPDGIVSAL